MTVPLKIILVITSVVFFGLLLLKWSPFMGLSMSVVPVVNTMTTSCDLVSTLKLFRGIPRILSACRTTSTQLNLSHESDRPNPNFFANSNIVSSSHDSVRTIYTYVRAGWGWGGRGLLTILPVGIDIGSTYSDCQVATPCVCETVILIFFLTLDIDTIHLFLIHYKTSIPQVSPNK